MMHLYVEPMDVVVVEVDRDGRVRLDTDEWIAPTLQEKRAILYAAKQELDALTELVDTLDPTLSRSS
jgi:dsDNA-specific endonuclease/ATPase MutS2